MSTPPQTSHPISQTTTSTTVTTSVFLPFTPSYLIPLIQTPSVYFRLNPFFHSWTQDVDTPSTFYFEEHVPLVPIFGLIARINGESKNTKLKNGLKSEILATVKSPGWMYAVNECENCFYVEEELGEDGARGARVRLEFLFKNPKWFNRGAVIGTLKGVHRNMLGNLEDIAGKEKGKGEGSS